MIKIEAIHSSLRIADDWQRKGQPTWVLKSLASALMAYLSIAVTEHEGPASGVAWLRDEKVTSILGRIREVLQRLAAEVEAGRLPSAVIAGNYHALVYAHLAWCLDEDELGEWFVAFSERPDVGEMSTDFWREYGRGMGALVREEPYQPIEMHLRGQEKYWMAYLRLIEAAANGQRLEGAIKEAERFFAQRNADKSIKDDAYQIEGSADYPVRWDFRSKSILNYVRHRTGLQN
jgi:hypothetical protein